MDNQNNNQQNGLPQDTPPQPNLTPDPAPSAPTWPQPVSSMPTSDPANSFSNPWQTSQTPSEPPASVPQDSANPWDIPSRTEPAVPHFEPNPVNNNLPFAEPATPTDSLSGMPPNPQPASPQLLDTQTSPPAPAEPAPTFTPPAFPDTSSISTSQSASSDNSPEAPVQPAFTDNTQIPTQPSWMTSVVNTPPAPAEAAPTDLSHLISNTPSADQTATVPGPETIESSTAPNPVASPVAAQAHKGIPKWLLGLGIGLLLIVIAASAYFILGIGQTNNTTTNLPAATTTNNGAANQPIVPFEKPVQPTRQPAASGSANFGQLQGGALLPTPQATSAADLIRQRQQP